MVSVLIFVTGYSFSDRVFREEKVQKEKAETNRSVGEIPEIKKVATKPEQTQAAQEKMKPFFTESGKEQAQAVAEEKLMQEITGLIIAESMTKIGYEFYETFFLLWYPPQTILKHYNILIAEKASPMWGSLVEVNIGETTIWSMVLRPRSEEIEDAVKQAIEISKDYLNNYEKIQFQTVDMVGTGI